MHPQEREIKEIRNYGYADKEEKKTVTDATRFKIASVSKTVTCYAVMQLVEQGKLDLDVPVNQYLTRWKIPQSEYGENKVTIRMLLSHIAGFEVLRQIREKDKEIPVIFLSARQEEYDKVLGLGLGADDYVTKPFSPGELMARVKVQLRRKKRENVQSQEKTGGRSTGAKLKQL